MFRPSTYFGSVALLLLGLAAGVFFCAARTKSLIGELGEPSDEKRVEIAMLIEASQQVDFARLVGLCGGIVLSIAVFSRWKCESDASVRWARLAMFAFAAVTVGFVSIYLFILWQFRHFGENC